MLGRPDLDRGPYAALQEFLCGPPKPQANNLFLNLFSVQPISR